MSYSGKRLPSFDEYRARFAGRCDSPSSTSYLPPSSSTSLSTSPARSPAATEHIDHTNESQIKDFDESTWPNQFSDSFEETSSCCSAKTTVESSTDTSTFFSFANDTSSTESHYTNRQDSVYSALYPSLNHNSPHLPNMNPHRNRFQGDREMKCRKLGCKDFAYGYDWDGRCWTQMPPPKVSPLNFEDDDECSSCCSSDSSSHNSNHKKNCHHNQDQNRRPNCNKASTRSRNHGGNHDLSIVIDNNNSNNVDSNALAQAQNRNQNKHHSTNNNTSNNKAKSSGDHYDIRRHVTVDHYPDTAPHYHFHHHYGDCSLPPPPPPPLPPLPPLITPQIALPIMLPIQPIQIQCGKETIHHPQHQHQQQQQHQQEQLHNQLQQHQQLLPVIHNINLSNADHYNNHEHNKLKDHQHIAGDIIHQQQHINRHNNNNNNNDIRSSWDWCDCGCGRMVRDCEVWQRQIRPAGYLADRVVYVDTRGGRRRVVGGGARVGRELAPVDVNLCVIC